MRKQKYSKEIEYIFQYSKTRLRESFIKNNYIDMYNDYILFTSTNNFLINFKFIEKFYYFINDVTTMISCKICDSKTTMKDSFDDGFRDFCSAKCAQKSNNTREKYKKTCLEKFGVDNAAKLDIFTKKAEETNLERYGTKSTFQNEEVRNKWKENIKEKYNVDHIFKLSIVKDKIKQTIQEKYNVSHYTKSDDFKNKLKEMDFSGLILEKNFRRQEEKYNNIGYELKSRKNNILTMYYKECGHTFDIYYETFLDRYKIKFVCCTICNPLNSSNTSANEIEILEWVNELNIEDIIIRDRIILSGKELDIYLPSHKIALEHNGIYWHNEYRKLKNYHKDKTDICSENDIHLIHIWEDDWNFKKDIVKSIILNKLGKIENKIYARKCEMKPVNFIDSKIFLNDNHIQGCSNSSYRFGLYHNNELVSLMTFGYRCTNNTREFELIRFCNKINTNIIGAASKLFTNSLKIISNIEEISHIVSYADRSIFNGLLYNKLNFVEIHNSEPNYYWVVDGKRYHRYRFNKKKLIKEGADPSKTGEEMMYDLGYYKVWGSGQTRYVYYLEQEG